jgi:hypothetical protein
MIYDTVTKLIEIGIRQPFTVPEAMERLGDKLGFTSNYMPTVGELRTQLPRDSRVAQAGERGKAALYVFK